MNRTEGAVRTRVVIQSRLSSSRLPGKAMMTIGGMPLIELVARRVGRGGHEVVVATSTDHYDEIIARHLATVGVTAVRGPLDDVLGRFILATEDLADDDLVVRMTGDNPVADADLVDQLRAATAAAGVVYGRNNVDLAPEGLGCEVFPARLLRQAHREATAAYDREHVTPWMRRAVPELDNVPTGAPSDIFRYRATIDCLDDYDVVSRAFAGVADPVTEPWQDLLARIGDLRSDPMVARAEPGLHGAAAVLLRPVPDGDPDRVRKLLRQAVAVGVSHLLVDPTTVEAVGRGIEPALRQRLTVLVELPGGLDATEIGRAVDRARVALAQPRLGGVVVPADVPEAARAALLAEHRSGTVAGLGVRLSGAEAVDVAAWQPAWVFSDNRAWVNPAPTAARSSDLGAPTVRVVEASDAPSLLRALPR